MDVFWNGLCKDLGVPVEVASRWRERIRASYSQEHRFYHNESVMFTVHKLPHLERGGGRQHLAIALAVIFQYLEFQPMHDKSDQNCQLFREFAEEAGLTKDQVSRFNPIMGHLIHGHSFQLSLTCQVLRLLGAQQQPSETAADVPEDLVNYFQDLDLAVLG